MANLVTSASQSTNANSVGSVDSVTAVTGSTQTIVGSAASGDSVESSSQAVIENAVSGNVVTGSAQSMGENLSTINADDVSGASQDTAGTINSSSVTGSSQGATVGSVSSTGSLSGSPSMSVYVGNSDIPAILDDIEFDVLKSIETKYSADAPDYAMEDGAYTSDSILKKPMELNVVAYVSEHPVTYSTRHEGRTLAEIRSELEEKYFAGELVTFTTRHNVYENMAITSLKIPQDDYLDAMEVSLTLKYINVTSAETADYEYDGASDSADSTSTTDAGEESSSSGSWLYQILGLFGIV